MIDTHCHLYLSDFTTDIDTVIEQAKEVGVHRLYLPAIDSDTHNAMIELEAKYPDVCFAMMGIHPCSIKADNTYELQIVTDWLGKRKFTAIGEIGLDFYWSREFEKQQYECFRQQMELALTHQLPIVIHTRNAMQETINEVLPYAKKGLKGIFHCFSGSYESATQIINMGFLLGIGGVATYKNAGLSDVLNKIDLKHLVLETDAPYLTPVPHRGKRNESSYIKLIAEKVAEIKQCTLDDVIKATDENAIKLFVQNLPE